MADSTQERVAVLEANRKSDAENFAELKIQVSEINSKVTAIDDKLTRQRGFIAGVMFAFSLMWVAVGTFVATTWESFVEWLFK